MFWDILLGILGAIVLIVLLSFVMTGLTDFYQGLLANRLKGKMRRPELVPVYARFAAVATIALFLVVALLLRISI